MKSLATLWFLLFSASHSLAFPLDLSKLPHVRQAGVDYVPLAEFGKAQGLRLRSLTSEGDILLTNSYSRFSFTPKTKKSEFNGIGVTLSHPILQKDGSGYISTLDIQTALFPLLFPSRTPASGKLKLVCLDPGHGGKDPGNIADHAQEKKHNLDLAREVAALLTQANIKVITTRSSDKYIERADRTGMANRSKADLFVSLHCNSAPSKSVRGVEVYCLTPVGASSTNAEGQGANSRASRGNTMNPHNVFLAYQVQKSLVSRLQTEDRSVRRARFEVLRDAAMPAILVETGYMSHTQEGKKLADPIYLKQAARAIVEGILSYQKITEG